MHVRSLGKILFFHFRSIKIVSHLTHILKRKRADLDLAVFLFIITIIIILLLKRPSTSCTFQFSLVLDCGARNFNLSIKCQQSLINKNSNVWGYTELDLQSRLLARRPSSRPKDGQFSELGDFRQPVLGGHLRTSVLNVTKQCL